MKIYFYIFILKKIFKFKYEKLFMYRKYQIHKK